MKKILFPLIFLISLFSCVDNDQEDDETKIDLQQGLYYRGIPRINSPAEVGNYPNTPFLYYVPVTGSLPIAKSVEGLPTGLVFDKISGIIKGEVANPGKYTVRITAKNAEGADYQELTIVIGDNLALTPTMGWNSWNTFGQHLSESLIIETAEAMMRNGMRDAGYNYINIDDFWQLGERGADGHMQINQEKFPNGIKHVANYLHEIGFKLGIYSDAADRTCGGVCGSYGYEEIDAKDFAEWGVDLLKYDYCYAPTNRQEAIRRYTKMGQMLRESGRSIIYSICEWGELQPWLWAKEAGGHYWRTTFDIRDRWHSPNYNNSENGVINIIDLNEPLSEYAGKGAWNDPDMLIVGLSGESQSINTEAGEVGCTPTQYRSHMSLWAMMAAPLLSGNDVRLMDEISLETLTNPDIIAINQDVLGKQAVRKIKTDKFQIWEKELVGNKKAIAYFNPTEDSFTIALDERTKPFLNLEGVRDITDVWKQEKVKKETGTLTVSLEPYECKVYILRY